MERLESFIERLMLVADRRNIAEENPITIMVLVRNTQFYTVVSYKEPNHVTLPLNVTWIVADEESPYYRRALRRASALPSFGFRNTWAELRTYEDFEEEEQFWDTSASFQLGEVQVTGVKEATETARGIFYLSSEPQDIDDPVVVSSDDPRMSDARQPLPHEHPLLPSTMLRGSSGINDFYVQISDGRSPRVGQALVLNRPAPVDEDDPHGLAWIGQWQDIEASSIVYDGPLVAELIINGPEGDVLDEQVPHPFTVDAVFDDGTVRTAVAASWDIIANTAAGTISTSTGVFTSHDVSGDQVVRVRARWTHAESNEEHVATYDLTVTDTTIIAMLERIEITGESTLDEGSRSSQYVVTAYYDDGTSRGVTPTQFTSSNSAAGSLDRSSGVFTTAQDVFNDQTTVLSATYTESGVTRSDSFDLVVRDVTVYPMSAEIQGPESVGEGEEVTFALIVTFTDMTTSQVAVSDWSVNNSEAGVIDSTSGLFIAASSLDANEQARITASYSSNGRTVNAYADIVVRDDDIYPVSATIEGPGIIDEATAHVYQMRVRFTDDTTTTVAASWSTSNEEAGVIDETTGEFTANELYSNAVTTLFATYTQSGQTVEATREITVRDITNYPYSARIVGENTMDEGAAQDLVFEVTYQDDTTALVAATWETSDEELLPVSVDGRITAQDGLRENRSAIITARWTEHGVTVEDTLAITIVDVTVYPTEARILGPTAITQGESTTFELEVTYQGGERRVEEVNTFELVGVGSITSDGRYTAPTSVTGTEEVVVSASFTLDGITVSATLDLSVVDDTAYPASARIIGPTRIDEDTVHEYEFEVTFTDATVRVVPITNWSSSNTDVATIGSASGVLTARNVSEDRTITISGSYTEHGETVDASVSVLVEDITNYPVSASVTGPNVLSEGTETVQYVLHVTFRDGTTNIVDATWTSTNPNAGSLSSSQGFFQPRNNVLQDTSTTIKGVYRAEGRTVEGEIDVTVVDETAYPVSASIVGPYTIDEEETGSFLLRVDFDDGSVRDVTTSSWMSSNPLAGTIDPETGIFTAAVNDTRNNILTTISASYDVDGTVVTADQTIGIVDTSIYVADVRIIGPSSVNEGETADYQFEVEYDDGEIEIVAAEGWTVSNTNLAFMDDGHLEVTNNFIGDRTVTIEASFIDRYGITHGAQRNLTLVDSIQRPIGLEIMGPTDLLEQQSAVYSAIVTLDTGTTRTVAVDFAIDQYGTFEGNELVVDDVDEDVVATISTSYEEHGVTVEAYLELRIEHIFPVEATIQGPATVIGGESASYQLMVDFSNGTSNVEDTVFRIVQEEVEEPELPDGEEGDPVDPEGSEGTGEEGEEQPNPLEGIELTESGELTTVLTMEAIEFQIEASYTHSNVTVTDVRTITVVPQPDAEPHKPRWGYAGYASPDLTLTHGSPQALVESLEYEWPDRKSGHTLTYFLPANVYAYFAYPKALGLATFTDLANNFAGAWDGATWLDDYSNLDATGPVEVTLDLGNGPEAWYIYRTDWPGESMQNTTFRVDFDGEEANED